MMWAVLVAGVMYRQASAALPPAEFYLPPETLAHLTIPHVRKAWEAWSNQPPARAWADPAVGPFRRHLHKSVTTQLEQPLSQLTGLDLSRLLQLAEGQATLALLPSEGAPAHPVTPSLLLILDVGSNSDELADHLHLAAHPSPDTRPPPERTVIQGVEFLTLRLPRSRLSGILDEAFPHPTGTRPDDTNQAPVALHLGKVGSVFLASTASNTLSQLLTRLATLNPTPRPSEPGLVQVRIRAPAVLSWLQPTAARTHLFGASSPSAWRILTALGLTEVQKASIDVHAAPAGWAVNLRLDVPAAQRRGLLHLLQFLQADAGPPPFVSADALGFRRARLPGPGAWRDFERFLQALDPSYLGVLQLFTGYAGRTDDADFDFQKGIIDLLGDDWMTVTYPETPESAAGSSMLLVSSPEPVRLLHGLRLIASPTYLSTFLPPDSSPPTRVDRIVAGQPVVTVTMPPMPWWDGRTGIVHMTHHQGYVAITSSDRILERFLNEFTGPTLAARLGIGEIAALIGAPDHGYFSYRDERARLRDALGASGRTPVLVERLIRWAALSETTTRIVSGVLGWLDFSSLPQPERLMPYFGVCTQIASADSEGLTLFTTRPRSAPAPLSAPP